MLKDRSKTKESGLFNSKGLPGDGDDRLGTSVVNRVRFSSPQLLNEQV